MHVDGSLKDEFFCRAFNFVFHAIVCFQSIPLSVHLMGGRAAGQTILDGSDQDYRRVGGDWQCALVREIPIQNSLVTSMASSGANTSGF
jgi:hypothetical protein